MNVLLDYIASAVVDVASRVKILVKTTCEVIQDKIVKPLRRNKGLEYVLGGITAGAAMGFGIVHEDPEASLQIKYR